MSGFVKVAVLVVATGMVTSLVLPGRQTPAVLDKLFGGSANVLSVVTGQKK